MVKPQAQPASIPEHQQDPAAHPRVVKTVAASTAALACDLSASDIFDITLTANCTLTFTNPPGAGDAHSVKFIFRQDATHGRTVTWPASVKWAGSAAPVITSSDVNDVDMVSMLSVDGGVTWLATVAADFG